VLNPPPSNASQVAGQIKLQGLAMSAEPSTLKCTTGGWLTKLQGLAMSAKPSTLKRITDGFSQL